MVEKQSTYCTDVVVIIITLFSFRLPPQLIDPMVNL